MFMMQGIGPEFKTSKPAVAGGGSAPSGVATVPGS